MSSPTEGTGDAAGLRYVLLIINEEAHIRELFRVAELLLKTTDLRPVIFMEDRLAGLGEPKIFTERGIEVLSASRIASADTYALPTVRHRAVRRLIADFLANPDMARRIPASLRYRLGLFGSDDIELVRILRSMMLKRAAVARAVLEVRSWASIVMSEDNVDLDTSVWITVARELGIRSVIVPYTISNTLEFAESFVNFRPYQVTTTPQNRTIGWLFSAWRLAYKGRRFLRTNCNKIVAVEQLGLTPPNPWLLNSGSADAIAVESEAMHAYYRAAGIPAGQLVTTGSLTDDVLASELADMHARRKRILQKFELTLDRPLLLCALPPDQNTFDRKGCEFDDFDDLMGYWGDCLVEITGWNVIVRPHPKTPPERVEILRQKGLVVSYDDTATLVPICDLYVACVTATLRWAVACGKPAVNFDVYQYGYDDYRGVSGILPVNSRAEFRKALADLTGNSGKRAALEEAQRRDASRWGMLDGASGKRIVALLRGGESSAAAGAVQI